MLQHHYLTHAFGSAAAKKKRLLRGFARPSCGNFEVMSLNGMQFGARMGMDGMGWGFRRDIYATFCPATVQRYCSSSVSRRGGQRVLLEVCNFASYSHLIGLLYSVIPCLTPRGAMPARQHEVARGSTR